MNKLNQIRTLLGLKPVVEKFASATLIDGTKVETAEGQELVKGSTLYVVAEDGSKQLAPAGVHNTETAEIEVDPNGQILRVSEKTSLAEVETEKPEAEVEIPVEAIKDIVKEIIDEEMGKVRTSMEILMTELESVKAELGKTKEKYNEFSKTPAASPLKTTFNETPASLDKNLEDRLKVLSKYKETFGSIQKY